MKNIRKILALILVAMTAILPAATAEEQPTIGIITQIENGAFTDMRDGIVSALEAAGYTNIDYQCAQGDATTLSTICNSMDGYDAVFTIATPAAQSFVNLESDTPLFFCAVSAPVAAGIITEMETPDKNATGTSNAIPVEDIFALADVMTPGITKYGLIYSTSQDGAVNTIESCEAYLDAANVPYSALTVNTSADVASVTEALIADGCDAIFVPNDANVQAGVAALAEICNENGIPTYCSSATTVASGCLATIAIDDVGIGEKTAAMAIQYLEGTPVEEIPAIVVGADYVSVNNGALAALALDLSGETLQVGDVVYDVHYLD